MTVREPHRVAYPYDSSVISSFSQALESKAVSSHRTQTALQSKAVSSHRTPSKPIRQLRAKGPSVALQDVLDMKRGGRIPVIFIQQIVNARRQLQSFHQVPAEQREVDDSEASRLGPEQGPPLAG